MAFNSFIFWIVFPLLFLLYWAIPGRYMAARKWYLIVVSYWLYMNWKPAFALVLLYVTLVTFYGAKCVAAIKENGKRKRSLISVLAVMALLPLLLFKYYAFVNENITAVMSWLHIRFSFPGLNWAIPVGISFSPFKRWAICSMSIAAKNYPKPVSATTPCSALFSLRLPVDLFPQPPNCCHRSRAGKHSLMPTACRA